MKNLISFLIKILVINFFIGFSGAHADDLLKIYFFFKFITSEYSSRSAKQAGMGKSL